MWLKHTGFMLIGVVILVQGGEHSELSRPQEPLATGDDVLAKVLAAAQQIARDSPMSSAFFNASPATGKCKSSDRLSHFRQIPIFFVKLARFLVKSA